jgi:hypothetical protein
MVLITLPLHGIILEIILAKHWRSYLQYIRERKGQFPVSLIRTVMMEFGAMVRCSITDSFHLIRIGPQLNMLD